MSIQYPPFYYTQNTDLFTTVSLNTKENCIMKIKQTWFYLLVFFSAFPLFLGLQCHTGIKKKIDVYMDRMLLNGFSGALFVEKDGKILLSKGYGLADREQKIPITNETVFPIGSITKQFTAAAILRLQIQGKLTVNDPITKFFKNVPADKASITLHQLLTHTAGFPGAIGDDFDPIGRDEFIQLAMKTKLIQDPGKRYEYSNVGYSLLGAIIELISGQSYEYFLHEQLFKPANMIKTGYLLPKWKKSQLAHGYRGNTDWGTLLDHPWTESGPGWHLRANGGILSTLEEMYRWHLALEGEEILTNDAKKAYYYPHVREGEHSDSFYGYGWTIFETPRNTRLISHNGGNSIFAADFLRYLDEDVVIIGFSNTAGKPAWKVTQAISRIVFGYQYTLPPEKVETLTLADLKASPMGKRALALLEIYAVSNEKATRKFIQEHFESNYIQQISQEKMLRFIQQDQKNIGKCNLMKTVKTDENTFEITVQSQVSGEWWLVTVHFEKKSPYTIIGIGITDTDPQ
jgi:CubicO group peptidase (beta-lactamase class C family)